MRRLVFVVSCMAGAVAACGGNSKSGSATVSVHPADSIFIPARRERFYRDPDTNEPDITLVVALELDSKPRFVLAQTRMDRGALAVVSDSAGLIPVFDSEAAARAYIAKVFPLDRAGGDTSVDAVAGAYGDMLALGGPTHLDLDRVLKWTVNPRSQTAGPLLLELAWEMLAAADAAPPMQQFDPMYMGAVAQRAEAKDADSLVAQVQLIGMKLTGIGSELRRRNLDENAPWQPNHSSL